MTSLVSFIVPVYNVEKYLIECLDSIKNQTYTNFECLLIDDGSTDGSGKICDDYCKSDNRFKVFHIPNGGVSNARNYGLSLFKGEYVTFVDSDDYISKYYLEVLLYLIEKTGTKVAISEIFIEEYVNKDEFSDKQIERDKAHIDDKYKTIDTLNVVVSQIHFACYSSLIYKELVQNNRFNVKLFYAEDVCFLTDIIIDAKNIVKTEIKLYFYRLNLNSAIHSTFKTTRISEIDAYNYLLKKYSFNHNLQKKIYSAFCVRLLVMLYNYYDDAFFRKQYLKSVIKLYRKHLKYILMRDTLKQKILHITLAIFPRLYLTIRTKKKKKNK